MGLLEERRIKKEEAQDLLTEWVVDGWMDGWMSKIITKQWI